MTEETAFTFTEMKAPCKNYSAFCRVGVLAHRCRFPLRPQEGGRVHPPFGMRRMIPLQIRVHNPCSRRCILHCGGVVVTFHLILEKTMKRFYLFSAFLILAAGSGGARVMAEIKTRQAGGADNGSGGRGSAGWVVVAESRRCADSRI